MHKFKFRFGDKVIVQINDDHGNLNKKKYKALWLGRCTTGWSYCVRKNDVYMNVVQVHNIPITPDYAGTFTLRKARGGFRYNVVGLNGEVITTSEVLVAKQSATEMHERHYRNYKLVDKTVEK